MYWHAFSWLPLVPQFAKAFGQPARLPLHGSIGARALWRAKKK
jgi:hypothetical protein